MTKQEAYRKAQDIGKGFEANLIVNWHSEPALKLKGLVKAIEWGHDVRVASDCIGTLLIDGDAYKGWQRLEMFGMAKTGDRCGIKYNSMNHRCDRKAGHAGPCRQER